MSAFPQRIYQPSVKDVVAQLAPARVSRNLEQTVAAVTVEQTLFNVPNDMVFLLRQFHLVASGGGAQTVVALGGRIQDSTTAVTGRVGRERPGDKGLAAAPAELNYNWSGEMVLMPAEVLISSCDFSAGAAGNFVRSAFNGILIPRGNWQLA